MQTVVLTKLINKPNNSNSSGCEHLMTHWWQWPDSIYSFPGSFCQDFSPTQLRALNSYVLLVDVEFITYSS